LPAGAQLAERVRTALHEAGVAVQSLACLLASDLQMADASLHEAASALGVPLRFAALTPVADISITVAEQLRSTVAGGAPRGVWR